MKKTLNSTVIFGIILVAAGIIFAGNELGAWSIRLFFDGWWTLFIIIPCLISMIQNGFNAGNIIGLCIGLFFLLQQQNFFWFHEYRKLIFPIIIVLLGLLIIFKHNDNNLVHHHQTAYDEQTYKKAEKTEAENKDTDEQRQQGPMFSDPSSIVRMTALFSGQDYESNHQPFHGADVKAFFGGVDMDIRNAIIDKDVRVDALCMFGGIDIFVPENIPVKVQSTAIFGGVDNMAKYNAGSPCIYIYATCVFGGIDIKFSKNKK
jgi:predicted membrane protein